MIKMNWQKFQDGERIEKRKKNKRDLGGTPKFQWQHS
jgi:hypothetical protein